MVEVKNLSKIFTVHILNDKIIEGFKPVSFTLQQGFSLGISGPSGAGKSSILKCIYRTYTPTSGSIIYESSQFGKIDLATADEHTIIKVRENEIGYITQFLKVIPRVTAVDIVAEPLVNFGEDEKIAQEKAKQILERLFIPKKLFEAYPATFSGGEQQRVNIARACLKAPRFLILDEPTASLDTKTTQVVLDILKELRKNGTTMIGIFHQRETLEEFSDNILYIEPINALE